jgi:uncharacterized protein (TIGR03435 family)
MTLEIFLAHPTVQALGHALLHFVWQGSLLAVSLWILKTISPPSAARLRYAGASLIMLMMPIALIVTATRGLSVEAVGNEAAEVATPDQSIIDAPSGTLPKVVLFAPTSSAPRVGVSGWVVCIWIVGISLLSFRAVGGWIGVQKLKRGASPASAELEDAVRRLKVRLSLSAPVRLCISTMVRVPTAIGWLRPYILLPITALTGLNETQIRAVLIHELAHIRRRDYLVNLLQTVIETMLFYHPAVWWVGKEMRREREHCCDDIAVSVCGSAFEYATALAEMEQIRDWIPEPAVAATGGDLLARIRRLLGRQDNASRSLGTITAAALLLFMASGTAIVSLRAAPQERPPAFEVASIKRDVSVQPGPQYRIFPGFTVQRATLRDLVKLAYFIHDFQVSGGPGWINSDRYNIEAKAEAPPAFNQEYRVLQLRRLQTLLQDRFKLVLHRETKELPVYELTVAKSSPTSPPPNCIQRDPGDLPTIAPGKTVMDYCGFGGFGRGQYQASSGSMPELADALALPLGRTVVDKTGITGRFRIQLAFAPDTSTSAFPDAGGPGRPAEAAPPTDRGPDIFTAIREQLGLKLESGKGPVEVLVIDHVEKPSEN